MSSETELADITGAMETMATISQLKPATAAVAVAVAVASKFW